MSELNIKTELFEAEKHYEAVCSWWKAESWPQVPLNHLPKYGVVISVDDIPACAAWLYQTDSQISWLEWVVANPEVRREKRAAALDELVLTLKNMANRMGFETIFMTARSAPLISRMEKHGFISTDKSMTNLIFKSGGL